jgi:hypothetical protein
MGLFGKNRKYSIEIFLFRQLSLAYSDNKSGSETDVHVSVMYKWVFAALSTRALRVPVFQTKRDAARPPPALLSSHHVSVSLSL